MASKDEVARAKLAAVKLFAEGRSKASIAKAVGLSLNGLQYHLDKGDAFASAVESAKAEYALKVSIGNSVGPRSVLPPFPVWCEEYMGVKLFLHQLQWFDMIEGRKPRDLHPSETYIKGRDSAGERIIINTPPNHGKSMTVTVLYTTYQIVKNPDISVAIISKTQSMAKKFLLAVKERLTDPRYEKMSQAFGPEGGWKEGSASWAADQFYVGNRKENGKDPTLQAVGIGGQLYGARLGLAIIDDAVDTTNSNAYSAQVDYINDIVASRLDSGDPLIVVGTRIANVDMYSELRNPESYGNSVNDDEVVDLELLLDADSATNQPWDYLLQPAVLEYADDPKDWVTLWPETIIKDRATSVMNPVTGLYPKWSGQALAKERARKSPASWARMYQQEQLADSNLFALSDIMGCSGARQPGLIPNSESLGRAGGMEGLYIVAGYDPAAVGFSAAVVYGIDKTNGHRWLIDVSNVQGAHPDDVMHLIKSWTDKYGIKEWRIERNAFQKFLTLNSELKQYLALRGCRIHEHLTGSNKNDPDWGVAAMSSLFSARLIHLPNASKNEAMKAFVYQLSIWQPNAPKRQKTDTVMAFWFCELWALELLQYARVNKVSYANSSLTTVGDIRRQASKDKKYVSKFGSAKTGRAYR